jgi:hypothetical protein
MATAVRVGLAALALAVALGSAAAVAEKATVTGVVGDAMCGVKHAMGGSEAECTQECIKHGSAYALIVDKKAYTLKTSSESTKTQLGKLAGKKATVNGERDGDTITVTSVEEAK